MQKVLFSLVNFAFSLVAVAIVMLWFRVMPSWHLILLPVCLLLLMCFCMGLGMMLSALTVFFRDVMPHLVRILVYANPMYNYLQFMRDIFLFQTTPSLMTFGMCVAWAVLALVIGYTVFHKSERKFILYI